MTIADTEAFGRNTWLVDVMYERYLEDPASISESWRRFFESDPNGDGAAPAAVIPPPQAQAQAAAEAPALPAPDPVAASPPGEVPQGDQPAQPAVEPAKSYEPQLSKLVGAPARIASRMEESRDLPTATSVRTIPAKLLEVNRQILNNQLKRLSVPGKVSFTHIIGWAVVRALKERTAMNTAYGLIDGAPHAVRFQQVNLGLAMDMPGRDGNRTLLVPNIKGADRMEFREFWDTYEEMVDRVRNNRAGPDDFAGTTATLTNPGTVGTVQSVPRLMPDQGVIVGVGALAYPPEYQAADPRTLAQVGIGRIMTITSTYDHRVIQGAESGIFLARIHELLLGEDAFYDEIFESMGIPYVPARWAIDRNPAAGSHPWAEKQARVFQLINMYRVRGHLIADLDPLRMNPPAIHAELDPLTYGITIWDLEREFATGGLAGHEQMTAGRILGVLRDAYCRTVGLEYMHIQVPEEKAWIQSHVEGVVDEITMDEKKRLLRRLNEAEAFERFIHTKYLGQKRFSLEGSESMIPLIDEILNQAADAGMADVTIGMSHRGRLNVLANIIGKSFGQVFREFEGTIDPASARVSGDVKYHLGAHGTHTSPDGNRIELEVAANPSHLEAVDPVLEGIVRAKQDRVGDGAIDMVLPLLIHGDAAFAGQGVVAETLNLSGLPGYSTGGTVHIVVNNQVGFTTDAADARSTFYATDIAKAVQAPILHVNGDDPEAVLRVARLAFGFRQRFHKDVVIDLIGYRRLGHNEGDDPSLTQPSMYAAIQDHPSVRDLYLDQLVGRGELEQDVGEAILAEYRSLLDHAFADTRETVEPVADEGPAPLPDWDGDTTVQESRLAEIEAQLAHIPDDFTVHPKLIKVLADRHGLFSSGSVDWALAEALAFGSLAAQGHGVRLAGEDSRRGTFSHRHAVLVDSVTEKELCPLERLAPDHIHLIDSMLSEFAAMGFEYGYSVVASDMLVAWEAQFGDFANGAQVIIDQYIAAGYDKWEQRSGLVVMLPHGFEGQGPEHSSARLERFLTLSAEENMRVIVPSTAGQLFHLFRRQVLDPDLKPAIVFTPKSLLRTRRSFSPVAELTHGGFRSVIDDDSVGPASRLVLCTGKIYYDLIAGREARGRLDTAVVRVEELYPFPGDQLRSVIERHGGEVVWAQEEPENMGGWPYMFRMFHSVLGRPIRLVSREASASPATGNFKLHGIEQKALVDGALD